MGIQSTFHSAGYMTCSLASETPAIITRVSRLGISGQSETTAPIFVKGQLRCVSQAGYEDSSGSQWQVDGNFDVPFWLLRRCHGLPL